MIEVMCFVNGGLVLSIEYSNFSQMTELEGRFAYYERFVENLQAGNKVCMCFDKNKKEVFYLINCDF